MRTVVLARAATLALLTACDADVRDPATDAPPLMPGCLGLVEREGSFVVPNALGRGRLVEIDGVDVGLIYVHDDESKYTSIHTRRLLDPFGAWPPSLGPDALHRDEPLTYIDAVARPDGAFVSHLLGSTPNEYAVGTFGEEGAYPGREGHPILEPSPGVGVYWHHEGALHYHATLDAEEPSFSIPIEVADPSALVHGLDGDGRIVIRGADGLFTLVGDTLTPFAPLPEGDDGTSRGWILPGRDGGVWYAPDEHPVFEMHHVGGEERAPVTLFSYSPCCLERRLSPSGSGGVVALAELSATEGLSPGGFDLALTDGEHRTHFAHAEELGPSTPFSVVASPDGRSVLVGQASQGFTLRRFDCATLD